HPNIITVYGVEEANGSSVIASEYIEGETLRERIARGPLQPAEALDIAAQIASALRAAHEAGIIHRDVKPENVMLRPDGYVKVLDFGIAKLIGMRNADFGSRNVEAEASPPSSTNNTQSEIRIPQLTLPGLIMGTDRYMSPEQARGQEVDARADVWSLGCVLYEMLSGRPPFTGETTSDVVAALLKTEPAPLPKVATGTPGELQRIVSKCLEKDREERYPSAEELFTDLRRLQKRLEASGAIGPSARLGFAARVAILIALTLCAGAIGLYFYRARSAPPVGDKKSIAVLPLKPISAAHRDEIYEVGIADSLINRLSSTGGLVVRPLSATRKYADIEQDPLAAGREQQADYVLASNYQLAGGKIRITAQLLEVASGQVEESYKSEKDTGDVFSMQDAVAEEIGKLLLARFSTAASRPLLKRGTTNEEAYRLYLQGMNFFDRRNGAKSVEAFEQAVRLDPDYAQAWAGVAHAHRTIASTVPGAADPHEGYRKSTEAIDRALELDPNLSEAYSARCDWKMYYEYDYGGAEAACKRAIELKPDSAVAHNVYARLLILNRFDEAIAEIRTAIELDPTSFYHQIVYTVLLTYARRYDEAAPQLETLAAMNPTGAIGRFWLVGGLAMRGNHAEAFERLTRFQKSSGYDEETMRPFKTAYQTSGWQGVLREQAKRFEKDNPAYFFAAYLYAPMGDHDRAFEYLEKSYQQRENLLIYLKVNPLFDSLRGDPRY
ncbi:MAG TPA: protein kinase, partial [Pyrinomonadaceae bacterium]|nr:protein kinase [Pyrinomonadaceae bacterium]